MRIRQSLCHAALAFYAAVPAGLLSSGAAHAAEPAAYPPATLESFLARAERHPEVSAAKADIDAAAGGVTAADRAPLPQISANLSSIDMQNGVGPGSWPGSKRLDKGVGIDWTWERGDKRLHRTQSAEHALEAARFDQIETLVQRRLAIARAFWDLVAAQEREILSAESLRNAEELNHLARRRLEKGDVSQQEAARVFIEAERARIDHSTVSGARELAAVALAQASGLNTTRESGSLPRAASGWPSGVSQSVPGRILDLVDERPDVRAARARVHSAQAALALARSLQVSDVTWGGGFNNYPPDQRASVQLRAQFPWQVNYRFEGEIRQASAQLTRSEELLRLTLQAAENELSAIRSRRVFSLERLAIFDSRVLTQAGEVLGRAEAAYSRGAITLTELLEARRTYRAVRVDEIDAHAEVARAASEWQLRTAPVHR